MNIQNRIKKINKLEKIKIYVEPYSTGRVALVVAHSHLRLYGSVALPLVN